MNAAFAGALRDEGEERALREVVARLGTAGAELAGAVVLRGGVAARVLRLDRVGAPPLVLRQPNAAWKGQDAGLVAREAGLLGWLATRGVPVPKVLHVEPDANPLGEPFYLMSFVDGRAGDALPGGGIPQAADALAALHDLSLTDAPPLPEREDPLDGLRTLIGDDPRLPSGPLRPGGRSLLHGDFWPGNLLFRGGALVALLDWEDAATGDPHSDLACALLEVRYAHGAAGSQAFLARYAAQRPVDQGALTLWSAYVAAGALSGMAHWGLPPAVEAHKRAVATAFREEALAGG